MDKHAHQSSRQAGKRKPRTRQPRPQATHSSKGLTAEKAVSAGAGKPAAQARPAAAQSPVRPLRQLRRFFGSRIAWAAVIPVACAAAFAWGFTLVTVALPLFVLLSLCSVTSLLRVNRVLAAHLCQASERAQQLEAIVAIDALPPHEQEALRLVREQAREAAEIVAGCGNLMSLPFLSHVTDQSAASGPGRRESRRLAQEMLASNLGPVLDLSHGGARIQVAGRRAPSGSVTLELSLDGQPIRLPSDVVWTCSRGGRREAGLRFGRLSREQCSAITRICMQHRKCTEFAA
jgi:hypothetical protein